MQWRPVVEQLIKPEDRFPIFLRDQIMVDGRIPDYYDGPYLDGVETTEGFARQGKLVDEHIARIVRHWRENPPASLMEEAGPLPFAQDAELHGGYGVPITDIAFVIHAFGRAFIWKR